MSSVTTAVADELTTMAAETVEKAPRRFPPPCWTQEEALVLIDAYRERWYALRRGYLRTADWDAVAAEVSNRCPGASPAKTSAQCRHKMEKLRQRYRAEKQRALSFPSPAGRYFSSWFFFENMDAMENGTTPPTSAEKAAEKLSNGSRVNNAFIDPSVLKLKLKAKSNLDLSPSLGFDNSSQAKKFNPATKDEADLINNGMRYQQMNRISVPIPTQIPPLKSRSKKSSTIVNNFDGFLQQTPSPGLRTKNLGSDYNPSEYFFPKFPNSDHSKSSKMVDQSGRSKYWSNINANSDPRSEKHGLKRGRNGLEEIVASIKMLGEGFVKMEKEKMEMSREIERVRMEMEMKRSQMLLESQKQIVDAFLKGMFEFNKTKKVKSDDCVGADSTDP
ncbi:hypothetical protein CASFOL_016074 [Castilleja foliolosa]|uniref:Myb-like domain-containing protein n=1 Tax=Castilleja foliolosa TaxID=1961234 RepID=A0ABD3DFJ2_9LAMI